MATKKSTTKKSTTKKPSLVKKVVDKIKKTAGITQPTPPTPIAPIVVGDVTKRMEDILSSIEQSGVSYAILMAKGFEKSELPSIAQTKKFGKISITQYAVGYYSISK